MLHHQHQHHHQSHCQTPTINQRNHHQNHHNPTCSERVWHARAEDAFGDIEFIDHGDTANDGDGAVCKVCHATSQTPSNLPGSKPTRMMSKTKCWFCHCTHLLMYGDCTWKDHVTGRVFYHGIFPVGDSFELRDFKLSSSFFL